jgi:YHS domain-containing protein
MAHHCDSCGNPIRGTPYMQSIKYMIYYFCSAFCKIKFCRKEH